MNPVLFSPLFGVLMVAAAARPAGVAVMAALALAAVAVLAAVFIRRTAVAAVLLTIGAVALGGGEPLFVAVSGLSATAYLLTRYAGDAVTLTTPTLLGMLGFAVAGVAATAVPVRLTWVPLVAPAIMAAILIVAVVPFVAEVFSGPGHTAEPPG